MERKISIEERMQKFFDLNSEFLIPHETLNKKQAEQIFRDNRIVEHNELGDTILPVEIAEKIRKHRGFDTSTIMKYIPGLYKRSILVDSQTEKEFKNQTHKKHNNIAFWHNTLNKFQIKKEISIENYIIRFTVEEDKIGKNKKKDSIGRKVLHSSFISNVTIEKGDIVMHTSNYLGRTISPDNILAHYLEIVKGESKI